MAYHKFGIIDAASYNQFVGLMNTLIADTNSGAISEGTASLGYGQASLPTISATSPVTAANWTALFAAINNCWIHQGGNMPTVGGTCPIPASVSKGQLVSAYNDYLNSQTLTNVISYLTANRMVTPPVGQYSQITIRNTAGGPNSPSWGGSNATKLLRLSFQVDFGSWNNARYFFNTGGAITLAGSGTGATPADIFWAGMLTDMGVLRFMWNNTSTSMSTGSAIGFYDLTDTTVRTVYEQASFVASAYSNSRIRVTAQLPNTPGTNGLVNIAIELVDNDVSPNTTTASALTFQLGVLQSAGTVPYPGPAVTMTVPVYTVTTNTPIVPPVPLTVSISPVSQRASIVGAGTAVTSTVTATPAGGTAPYTYSWTNLNNTVTFSAATSAATTFSRALAAGEVQTGIARLTVTDNVGATTNVSVPWALNSNLVNSPTGT